jgi:hypothetical protein
MEAQFGERLGRYAAEAGNVFNEDLLISDIFLDGLQPFAAHYIRSRVTNEMTFAQVQQEAEDAGLEGRTVAASSRSLALPRTCPIRLPLAPVLALLLLRLIRIPTRLVKPPPTRSI